MAEAVFGRNKNGNVTLNGKDRFEINEILLDMIETRSDYNEIRVALYNLVNDIRILEAADSHGGI